MELFENNAANKYLIHKNMCFEHKGFKNVVLMN